ncbi:hypothetical protein SXIM_32780 [Streptomyces xiamenensis]|uniref:Molecular chaperone DnaJ n=1 Tax=Streptomyces xiamenensis TaxID=408015 RepID=A0A0F7FVZ7_9ACTN|nr:hypothetical protein SXIM_32780 [Streptomyces xiamenensis]
MGKHEKERPDCPVCGGEGEVPVSGDGSAGGKPDIVSCTVCGGSGKS